MKTIYGLIIIVSPILLLWGMALLAEMLDKLVGR